MYTDHKPLTYALPSASEHSPRQDRHLSFIAEFTFDIQYICGKHNVVADALPRIQAVTTPVIDLYQLAMDQTNSEEIEANRTSITGLELQDVPFQDVSLLCDVSLGKPRPVVPRSWTYRVFEVIHSLAHPGPRSTQRAVADRFISHGLKKTSEDGAKNATPFKLRRFNAIPEHPFPPGHPRLVVSSVFMWIWLDHRHQAKG